MGVQAETWGWALGQPMGLRWGVQSVDWASKTRGRAPVGRCAWRFPGDTPEFEFRRVASFEIYATLSTSATLIPSLGLYHTRSTRATEKMHAISRPAGMTAGNMMSGPAPVPSHVGCYAPQSGDGVSTGVRQSPAPVTRRPDLIAPSRNIAPFCMSGVFICACEQSRKCQ